MRVNDPRWFTDDAELSGTSTSTSTGCITVLYCIDTSTGCITVLYCIDTSTGCITVLYCIDTDTSCIHITSSNADDKLFWELSSHYQ